MLLYRFALSLYRYVLSTVYEFTRNSRVFLCKFFAEIQVFITPL